MMLRPAIGELLKKVGTEERAGTRYALVIATAKRARKLNEHNEDTKSVFKNYVSDAVADIHSGTVKVVSQNKS